MKLEIMQIFDELFPINRCVAGEGLRKSLEIIKRHLPLNLFEYPSGSLCFDWEVPPEWSVKEAYIEDLAGNRIIDFEDNNLHLVSYSIPFDGIVSREELMEHLYFIEDQPKAIPYITSVYERRWGFCIQYEKLAKFSYERYHVRIDAELKDGSMTVGEGYVKGRTSKEVLLHTYIGHPSMANDQLSGPLTLMLIYEWLLKNQGQLNNSYRLLFCPETIGTIAFLSRNHIRLKRCMIAGYVVAFTGDGGALAFKRTKENNSLANRAAENALQSSGQPYTLKEYTPGGADERHFNSPGINLPVGCFMRSGPEEYIEYHTSLDDKSIISLNSMEDAAQVVINAIRNIEINCSVEPVHLHCEPKLDKRGVYPTLGKRFGGKKRALDILNIWGLSDSCGDLIEIADRLGKGAYFFEEAIQQAKDLEIIRTGATEYDSEGKE